MSKNSRAIFLLALILCIFLSSFTVQASSDYLDQSQLSKGVIKVNYNRSQTGAIRVTKGKVNYDYVLGGNNIIPLQLGNGDYTISILENIEGKRYRQISKETVRLNLVDSKVVYMQSNQKVNWGSEMEAIKEAKDLTQAAKNDREKVIIIYNYLINNIKYDREKAKNVSSNYLPNIDDTLNTNMGICYDYASLFAAMTRSLGLPTKLLMGRTSNIKEYHAWNQVYLEDINDWITIDTTYDAGLLKGNMYTAMIKNDKDYNIEKEY